MKTCAFTGHRHLPSSLEKPLRALLSRGIAYVYSEGVRDFYAGGALGFDMLAEEEVLRFRKECSDVRLHLLLPHRGQAERWNFSEVRRYHRLLSEADSVAYLSDYYYDGVMRERNQALIDAADVCIAYLVSGGGTAQTVAMAKRKGITVYNLKDGMKD